MNVHDVSKLRERLNQSTTRANERLGSFDADAVGIGRYVPGSSPWERHNNGDELLLVTDGKVQIEILQNDGSSRVDLLDEGALFVVPKGLWHQLTASANVNIFYISPSDDGVDRTKERPRAADTH